MSCVSQDHHLLLCAVSSELHHNQPPQVLKNETVKRGVGGVRCEEASAREREGEREKSRRSRV